MVTSGITVPEEIIQVFNSMKMNHDKRYLVIKIVNENQLILEHEGDKDKSYNEFAGLLPPNEPRFAVVDF